MLTQKELLRLTSEGFAATLKGVAKGVARVGVGATSRLARAAMPTAASIVDNIRSDLRAPHSMGEYNTPEKRKIVDILDKRGLSPGDITQTGSGTWSVYVTDTDGVEFKSPVIFKKNDAGQIEMSTKPAKEGKTPLKQSTASPQPAADAQKKSQDHEYY